MSNRLRRFFWFSLLAAALAVPALALAQSEDDDSGESSAREDDSADDESATDATDEPADTPAQNGDAINVDQLRLEYLKLRDRLFRSRARAAAVGSALYSTKVSIHLNYASARHYTVTRSTVRLDGANVFDDTDGTIGSNTAPRFEGYIAPGRHQVSFRIEATGKDDDRFTTTVEHSVVVQAPAGKDLTIRATAEDDGDIAFNWKKKQSGSYKLHLDIAVKSEKRNTKKERIRRASR